MARILTISVPDAQASKETALFTPKSLSIALLFLYAVTKWASAEDNRAHISIRGTYGGVPTKLLEHGTLHNYGVNAIFIESGGINAERVAVLEQQEAKVFAEFNTMHVDSFLNDHAATRPQSRRPSYSNA